MPLARKARSIDCFGPEVAFRSEVRLRLLASDQVSSYHSRAGREQQEARGPDFSPNQSLLAAF
jgi:hypothetical protein